MGTRSWAENSQGMVPLLPNSCVPSPTHTLAELPCSPQVGWQLYFSELETQDQGGGLLRDAVTSEL